MPQRLDGVSNEQRKDFEPFRPALEATLGGFLPNSLFIMAHDPNLVLGFGLLSRAVFRGSARTRISLFSLAKAALKIAWRSTRSTREPAITDDLRALIFLAASLSAGCRYCQAHSATQALDRGHSDEKIGDILVYDKSPHYSDAERAAIAVAFSAGQAPNATTDEEFDALRRHYSDSEIIGIVAAISYMGFLNRWNETFATTLEERPGEVSSGLLKSAGWHPGKHA